MGNQWIDIRFDKPSPKRSVLFWVPLHGNIVTGHMDYDGTFNKDCHHVHGPVTHWMKLPKPPEK